MPRPIQCTIHTEALRHNLQRARQGAPDARVWAVVKANAYGHGIERVFDALRGMGDGVTSAFVSAVTPFIGSACSTSVVPTIVVPFHGSTKKTRRSLSDCSSGCWVRLQRRWYFYSFQ